MALFEEITDRVAQLAKVGSKKVKNTGKIASLKVSNLSAQEEINKLYAKIGERYYREHGLAPEAGYEKLCDKVTDIMARIRENDAAITELKIDGVVDDEVVDPEDVED
ncbi:MAG: serine proteinase [Clostridiales bacterium]|nr:serine proteinase [Clostridiales bacterium]